MIRKTLNVEEVGTFLKGCGPNTKIYIGGDSERYRVQGVWFADYTIAVVIHMDGCHGARVFGEMTKEHDYDQKKNRPAMRLMNEVYKVSEMYLRLAEVTKDFEVEVHLDINPDEMHGSSCVVHQAIGYIKGTCNVTPIVKPNAFAASFAADRLKEVFAMRGDDLQIAS